jgi:hypothetical protein
MAGDDARSRDRPEVGAGEVLKASRTSVGAHAAPLVRSLSPRPRYFTVAGDDRKAIYLTGSHIWNN